MDSAALEGMRSQAHGTVLIIDDTEDNLRLAERVLRGAGIHCITASGGSSGLEAVSREPVDVVLLDLIMPRMDGWMTLAALRRDPKTSGIPVVMFTCDDRLSVRERAMKEGVVDFLPRPVARERLLECVRTHLEAAAHARAVDRMDRDLDAVLSRAE